MSWKKLLLPRDRRIDVNREILDGVREIEAVRGADETLKAAAETWESPGDELRPEIAMPPFMRPGKGRPGGSK